MMLSTSRVAVPSLTAPANPETEKNGLEDEYGIFKDNKIKLKLLL